jgi:hypothetical protein
MRIVAGGPADPEFRAKQGKLGDAARCSQPKQSRSLVRITVPARLTVAAGSRLLQQRHVAATRGRFSGIAEA